MLQLLPVKLIACSEYYTAGIVTHDKFWDENGYRSVYFSVEPEACNETVAETLLKNAVSWTLNWTYKNITTLLGNKVRVPNELADTFKNAVDSLPRDATFSDSIVLVEEGQTIVEINATAPGNIYVFVAHPTCEKVNITLLSGNGEVQTVAPVAEGLTNGTIQAYEEDIIEVAISADPNSSLNPAYIAVVPLADTIPPIIFVLSPENKTYPAKDVPLTFTVDEATSWIGYSLDGQINETIPGNTTLSGLSEGTHTIIVYAKDVAGNTGASEIIYFSIKIIQAEPPLPPPIVIILLTITAAIIVGGTLYFIKGKPPKIPPVEATETYVDYIDETIQELPPQ